MQIRMRYHDTSFRMAQIQTLTIANVGKRVEQQPLLSLLSQRQIACKPLTTAAWRGSPGFLDGAQRSLSQVQMWLTLTQRNEPGNEDMLPANPMSPIQIVELGHGNYNKHSYSERERMEDTNKRQWLLAILKSIKHCVWGFSHDPPWPPQKRILGSVPKLEIWSLCQSVNFLPTDG